MSRTSGWPWSRGEQRRPARRHELLDDPAHDRHGPARVGERDEVARVRAPGRGAPRQPLDVVHGPERVREPLARDPVLDQRPDRLVPRDDRVPVRQRPREPAAEEPRADRGRRLVDDAEERRLPPAVPQRLQELEVRHRRVVEPHVLGGDERARRAEPGERGGLDLAQVRDDRPRRADRAAEAAEPEPVQRLDAESAAELPAPELGLEPPAVPERDRQVRLPLLHVVERLRRGDEVRGDPDLRARAVAPPLGRDQELGRPEPLDLRAEGRRLGLGDAELAGRGVDPRDPDPRVLPRAVGGERDQVRRPVALEQPLVERRPRRHDLDDAAVDDPLGGLRVLELLADRDLVPLLDELPHVAVDRLDRHARQRHLGRAAVVARGQRDPQHARGRHRVVLERLVEVPHAEEQDRVPVLLLDARVLAHERRGAGAGSGGHGRCTSRARRVGSVIGPDVGETRASMVLR